MNPLDDFFRDALKGLAEQLDSATDVWRRSGDDSDLRRLCHSIKGSGGTFGYPLVSVLAAAAERAMGHELDAAVAMLKSEMSVVASATASKKILVVDDDDLICRLLEHWLNRIDRSVRSASNIASAREALETESYDLVIVDLVLPDGDGRHLLADLGERITSASTPVIVLSGSDASNLQSECLSLGARAFVSKPFDPDRFADLVGKLLSTDSGGFGDRADFARSFETYASEGSQLSVASILSETHGPGGRPSLEPDHTVLHDVDETIRASFGDAATLSRWGEAELALVTLGSHAETVELLNRARLRLRTRGHPTVSGAVVSLSAGVVEDASQRGLTSLMSRARRLAVAAHERGGDRVNTEWVAPLNRRVLLAEDDALTAALVIHRLESEGFLVDHYANGEEAAAAFDGEPFDLVLLDVQMPGLDGFEVLRRIRSIAESKIPVVMLTAVGSERDVVRGFELGADDYILKPFSPAELTLRLKRLVGAN